ncbi:MAG: hypothetical protein ACFFCW_19855 [Candidatus Hodarchaeota archaeon]
MRTWIDNKRRKRKIPTSPVSLAQSIDHLIWAINGYYRAWKEKKISRRQYLKRKEELSIILHEDRALLISNKGKNYPVAEEIDKALF